MSLLLSWETPPELYDAARSAGVVEIRRRFANPELPIKTVGDGQPWGFYEDVSTDEPECDYTVVYKTLDGGTAHVVPNGDIRRWVRPTDTCRIDFAFTRPDSSPYSGRRMKLVDLPLHHWVRDLWTDRCGAAHFVAKWGMRLRLEVEGWAQALEFVVPHQRTVKYSDLDQVGTWVRVDERAIR